MTLAEFLQYTIDDGNGGRAILVSTDLSDDSGVYTASNPGGGRVIKVQLIGPAPTATLADNGLQIIASGSIDLQSVAAQPVVYNTGFTAANTIAMFRRVVFISGDPSGATATLEGTGTTSTYSDAIAFPSVATDVEQENLQAAPFPTDPAWAVDVTVPSTNPCTVRVDIYGFKV